MSGDEAFRSLRRQEAELGQVLMDQVDAQVDVRPPRLTEKVELVQGAEVAA